MAVDCTSEIDPDQYEISQMAQIKASVLAVSSMPMKEIRLAGSDKWQAKFRGSLTTSWFHVWRAEGRHLVRTDGRWFYRLFGLHRRVTLAFIKNPADFLRLEECLNKYSSQSTSWTCEVQARRYNWKWSITSVSRSTVCIHALPDVMDLRKQNETSCIQKEHPFYPEKCM